jgi:ceramide glucosyltransferase
LSHWFAVPALSSSVYQALGVLAARAPLTVASTATPAVSILKPVRGHDIRFSEAILSHAQQDYPEFEILFGVRSESDSAVPAIRDLITRYANVRLILCDGEAPNGKVAVLAQLQREARFPILLVNDSDIRVEPDYLRKTVSLLADPYIGLVTCLYRAVGESLPAKFEALGVSTDFAEGVLVARLLGDSGFALGSTMAFRASDLSRIGGFAAIDQYLADDFQLGLRIRKLGLRIALAPVVVETHLGAGSWRDVWKHQLRWARTIRASRPGGYCGMIATQTTFWALFAAAAGEWPAFLIALAVRMCAAWRTGWSVLRDPQVPRRFWLVPIRDLFGAVVWIAGLLGTKVEWRGERLKLTRDGLIHKAGR